MFNSPLLDSAIALITLYLLFSQLTLSLVELPAGFLNTRGKYLYDRLAQALGPQAHAAFYAAPAIQALMLPKDQQNPLIRGFISGWPAYVSDTLFAQTVIGWVSGLAPVAVPPLPGIRQFEAGLAFLQDPGFKGLLETLYANATATAATPAGNATPEVQSRALQKNLEGWFHDYGQRMTGWYKRDNRKYLFWGGFVVAMAADVDTVRLARFLSDTHNAKARLAMVEAGVRATQGPRPVAAEYDMTDTAEAAQYKLRKRSWDALVRAAGTNLQTTLAAVPPVGLPLGFLRWRDHSVDTVRTDTAAVKSTAARRSAHPLRYTWAPSADDYQMPKYAQRWKLDEKTGASKPLNNATLWNILGGWLLTAFAMMLGAPFWFDTLCKFVNIRNVGIKPAPAHKPDA